MALAMMYAIMVLPAVQPIQPIQWIAVFRERCFEPRKMRMKKYFAAS